ncbi:Facilitated trehalose transporter Tret1 [Chamberlinius hualienensis]
MNNMKLRSDITTATFLGNDSEMDILIDDDDEEDIIDIRRLKPKNHKFKWLPWQMIFSTLSATLGSMCIGNVISFTSPLLPQLKGDPSNSPIHLSPEQESWVAGLVPLCAIIGGLIGGPLTDLLGRKIILMIAMIPLSLGWLVITASYHANMLYVGRGLTGLSSGILLVVIPIYVAETSPANRRGLLLSFHALWLHFGTLWTYIIGAFVSWRWLATIDISLCLFMITCMTFVPETPRWLVLHGRHSEAKMTLIWLRGGRSKNQIKVNEELEEIENSISQSNCAPIAKLKDFKHKSLYVPLLFTLGLMFFQILAGIDVIWFYTVSVFQTAGSEMDPYMQTIIVGIVGVLGSIISSLFMDSFGRRPMLVVSGLIMAVCMATLGVYFRLNMSQDQGWYWLPLVCVVLYLLGFDFAWGPIPNALVGELLPSRARGVASSITVAWAWFLIFLVTKGFVNMRETIHEYGAFWLFAGISFGGVLFVLALVPETKGKSLEQIELIFK